MVEIYVCLIWKSMLRILQPRFIPVLLLLSRQNNLTNLILPFDCDTLPPLPTKLTHLSVFVINTVCTDWLISAVGQPERDKMSLGCFYIQDTGASVTSAEETSAVIWTAAPRRWDWLTPHSQCVFVLFRSALSLVLEHRSVLCGRACKVCFAAWCRLAVLLWQI